MKEVQAMPKYSVYYYQGNEEKIWGETHYFGNADRTAQELSLASGVNEALVYNDKGELLRVYVNGNEVDTTDYQLGDSLYDDDQNPFAPYDYEEDINEIGYNPYIGCCDDDC